MSPTTAAAAGSSAGYSPAPTRARRLAPSRKPISARHRPLVTARPLVAGLLIGEAKCLSKKASGWRPRSPAGEGLVRWVGGLVPRPLPPPRPAAAGVSGALHVTSRRSRAARGPAEQRAAAG